MAFLILFGLLSGLALPTAIGSFRFPDLGVIAWFSLIPLYLKLKTASSWKISFREGCVWGAAYYGVTYYWIFIALHVYGEVSTVISILGLLSMIAIEAVFVGATTALTYGISRHLGNQNNAWSLGWIWACCWVLQDFLRNFFPFGGFPWGSLAYTQTGFLTLLQVLDVTGIYGIVFLIVLGNATIGDILFSRPVSKRFSLLFLLLLMLSLIYGRWRLADVRLDLASRPTLTASLIQGNIPQEEKWLEENIQPITKRHVDLTLEAEKESPDLILWPEAAYPDLVIPGTTRLDFLKNIAPVLLGAVTYEGEMPEVWPLPENHGQDFKLFNSAFFLESGGKILQRYDKHHLVPLGEYIPLPTFLSFVGKIVQDYGIFSPGQRWELMTLPNQGPKFGVTICYEDLFPEISRRLTQLGADFLVNLTNDAWYEKSSAIYQHADFSRFRAIENRRTLVRSTNTGLTALFGPTGEIITSAPLFEEAILTGTFPLGGPSSFYSRFGDVFVGAVFFGLLFYVLLRNFKKAVTTRAQGR